MNTTTSLCLQVILLVYVFRELKCQDKTSTTSQTPFSQQPFPQNGQQSFPQNTQQSLPPNIQQSFSQNSLPTIPPNSPQQQFQPSYFQQNTQPFQNTPFMQPSGAMQQSYVQPYMTQPPSQQQSPFQTQQSPSFSELQFPPTAQMPYPIQGQAAEFLQRPNANQLQTNTGQLPNANSQFSNQGQPNNQFSNQGQPNNQFSNQGLPNTQFSNQGLPSGTQFPNLGQPNPQFPQLNTQFSNQGQPTSQFSNQGQPTSQFSSQVQPAQPNPQFSNHQQQQQPSPNNLTPAGTQNTIGTNQNPTGVQTGLQSIVPGSQISSGVQPPQTPSTSGTQMQTPVGAHTQIQQPPVTGQILPQDNLGMHFSSPEAQVAATYVLKQLSSLLNDPTTRDAFVYMMSDFRNILANPQAFRVIQAYNGQIQDRLNNPQAYNYNNNVPLPSSNSGMSSPTITSPAGYYNNKHQQTYSTYPDLASIITSTTSNLADLIKYKGRILTNLLRDEVQVKSKAVEGFLGEIPGVNTLARMGTGIADQFVGTIDKTLNPLLNTANSGTTTEMTNPQGQTSNTIGRVGNSIMDQTFGTVDRYLNAGSGGSAMPSNTVPNGNNLTNSNYQTTTAPTGSNYPGYNEFNRQNKRR